MAQPSRPSFSAIFAVLVPAFLAGTLAGCDRPPSDSGAREWTAQDHDHADEKSKVASGSAAGPRAPRGERGERGDGGSSKAEELLALVELTWQKQCSTCHGPEGKGDGPQGPMFKAQDLTAPEWQSRTSDQAIASTIKTGKGAMPKFDLSPEIVGGLVGRIRAARSR